MKNPTKGTKVSEVALRDIPFHLEFYKTFTNSEGQKIDMYWLTMTFDGSGIGISVPHGRKDIAEFVHRTCVAGQRVLLRMPPGTKFEPEFPARKPGRPYG
jgi:hypothetical protein